MSQTQVRERARFERSEQAPCWENDLLNRKHDAHQLEQLIANTPGPYVIAMTSEWGSGKTFFLKAWEHDLKERKRPCVYFNAWETDCAGDPLIALTGCVIKELQELNFLDKEKSKIFAEKAKNIIKRSPKALIKLLFGLANHFTGDALKEIQEAAEDSLTLGTDMFLEHMGNRKSFSEELKEITQKIETEISKQPKDSVNESQMFPLFIMIDELDRCRPTYAVELLESIKHLFGVKGVVFLLAIDGRQIFNIIEHVYGLKSDENRDLRQDYLKKFIDVFWRLSEPNIEKFVFTKLKTSDVKIPTDWPTQSNTIGISNKFYGVDAFYRILSAAFYENTSKTLRECTQYIDKFKVITSAYKLNFRESFLIFHMIISKQYEIFDQDFRGHFCLEDYYPNKNKHNGNFNCGNNVYSSIYTCIMKNIFEQVFYPQDLHITDPDAHAAIGFLQILQLPFNGKELLDSATNKLKFLDQFSFSREPAQSAQGIYLAGW